MADRRRGELHAKRQSGQLSAPLERIAETGSGTFLQSGGTNLVNGSLYVWLGRRGRCQLGGSGWLSVQSEFIGFEGTGSSRNPAERIP